MKRLLVLSVVLSISAIAAPIGSCVSGALSNHLSNPCSTGDKVFDNFAESAHGDDSGVHFQMVAAESHLMLGPGTGAGFINALSFIQRIAVQPGVSPNLLAALDHVVEVKDQSNVSPLSANAAGQVQVASSPAPVNNLVLSPVLSDEKGDPTVLAPIASLATISTVPEPASSVLIGGGLLGLGLLRRRGSVR